MRGFFYAVTTHGAVSRLRPAWPAAPTGKPRSPCKQGFFSRPRRAPMQNMAPTFAAHTFFAARVKPEQLFQQQKNN
jgi:hypothetical protein